MGQTLGERLRTGAGTADEWWRDREADLVRGAAELEARGHRLYGQAIRRGEQVVARTTSELRDFAKTASGGRPSGPPASATSEPRSKPVRSGQAQPSAPRHGDRRQQTEGNPGRREAAAPRSAKATLQQIANSQPARQVAGDVARVVGNVAGLGTGTLQTMEDMKDGAALALRLLNPADPFLHPRGEAGWDQMAGAANLVVQRGKQAIADPKAAIQNVMGEGRKLRQNLDPTATPQKPTAYGEMRRNFDIGRNQGELAVGVAGLALGGAELKAASTAARISKAERIAMHRSQGFSEEKAAYLAERYTGRGHHAIIPERTRLPAWAGGGPVPRAILDSPFNVLKPEGITRGDFYPLHSKVDSYFYGTGFPRRMGPGGWSSKVLGIEKYGLPSRIWYGTPGPTKAVLGGAAIEAGGALNEVLYGDERR